MGSKNGPGREENTAIRVTSGAFWEWGGRHRELLLKKEKLFHLRAGVLTKHTFLLKKARYRNRSFPKKESGEGAGGGGGG